MNYTTRISIEWCYQDVKYVADGMGVGITNAEVGKVLELIRRNHDAKIGVTWDTIEYNIKKVLKI